jgi:hypothetical protein
MQYNYSHDNDGAGFLVGQFSGARPMENITVRYNISQNDAATNGGSVYLFNGQNPIRNISVYNNTFYISEQPTNTSSAAVKFLNQMPINDNIVIYNNILIAENGAKLVDVPVGYSAEFLGNLYYTTSTFEIDYQGTTYSSLAAFRATGNEFSSPTNYGYEGDPLLQDAGNGGTIGFGNNLNTLSNYMLTSLSPAIDIGFAVPFTVTQDFYGNNAIINGSGDIGAHEYDTNLNVIHTELENNISLFSNPTKSIIHIKSANNMIQNLTLYNLLGKEISTVNNINSFEYELAVRGLTQSVYLVKIKTLNGSVTKRFVRN